MRLQGSKLPLSRSFKSSMRFKTVLFFKIGLFFTALKFRWGCFRGPIRVLLGVQGSGFRGLGLEDVAVNPKP